jgi:hypothetical protein
LKPLASLQTCRRSFRIKLGYQVNTGISGEQELPRLGNRVPHRTHAKTSHNNTTTAHSFILKKPDKKRLTVSYFQV